MRYVEEKEIHVPFATNQVNARVVSIGGTRGVCQLTTTGASATNPQTTVLGMPGAARYDECPKKAEAWAQGDRLVWSTANHEFEKGSGAGVCAIARVASLATDETGGSIILTTVIQT